MDIPLVTVVKLISAEQSLAFDEAQQYMDVAQVYSKLGSKTPVEDWKQLMNFQYNLGKDKKFSNNFEYYDYDIEEAVAGNNATVCFRPKNINSSLIKITYGLEKRQNKWMIVSIESERRPDANPLGVK
jgi:hypothetical protein